MAQRSNRTGEGRSRGRFEKGGAGGPGRPPGSRNVTSAMLRGAFLDAFDELGGRKWLMAQARKDPRTFIRCLTKILPREMAIKVQEQTQPINLYDADAMPIDIRVDEITNEARNSS